MEEKQNDTSQQAWVKHPTSRGSSKSEDTKQQEDFYGNQVERGGGHFLSEFDYNLDDVSASLNLPPSGEARVATAEEDAFDAAFTPLRQASENAPSVRPLVDLLEKELRKGADANDSAASNLVRTLIQFWPDSLPLLRQLLTVSPTSESIGPTTRAVIEKGK